LDHELFCWNGAAIEHNAPAENLAWCRAVSAAITGTRGQRDP
jgi:hypothetical protein